MKVKSISILIAAALLSGPCAAADTWPNRMVRFIVALGSGSTVDMAARLFADKLSERWGQSVVVEDKPGGDGMLAITSFLAAHDNHVLLVSPVSSFTAHPYFHDKLPYDPKDLVPIAQIYKTVVAVSVPSSLNVSSLKELEALARAKPGQLNWTTVTGFTDFMFAGFLHTMGLKMEKVPYKNPAAAINDLAAGRIQVLMSAYAIVPPLVHAGKVMVLAITNHDRASAIPNIPTVVEAGYPSLEFDGLVGIFGPPGISDAVRNRIADDIRAVASDHTIVQKMTATGQIISPANPAEFATSIEQQRAQIATLANSFANKPAQ